MRLLLLATFTCALLFGAGPGYDRALDLYEHTDYEGSLKLLLPLQKKGAVDLTLIGQNYFMLGDAKRASDFFQQAVAVEPNNSVYHHWLGRAYGRRAETGNPFSALGQASMQGCWCDGRSTRCVPLPLPLPLLFFARHGFMPPLSDR